MSEEFSIPRQDDRADGTTMTVWGTARAAAGRTLRALAGPLRRDRRLPPVLALLGAVAALASMVGEWLVLTVPDGGPDGDGRFQVPGGVAEVGGFGVAYLVGLVLLAGTVAVALRGRPVVRHDARVAGLAVAGTLVVLLTATALTLDDAGQRAPLSSEGDGSGVDYGRGLVIAFAAAALLGAALLTAAVPSPMGRRTDGTTIGTTPDDGGRDDGGRDARRGGDEGRPAAPADLTVTPTVPFARREPELTRRNGGPTRPAGRPERGRRAVGGRGRRPPVVDARFAAKPWLRPVGRGTVAPRRHTGSTDRYGRRRAKEER